MKNLRIRYVVIAVSIAVFFSLTLNILAVQKIDTIARVTMVEGDVSVKKDGEESWNAIDGDTVVKAGDQIKTGARSSCVIVWSKENTIKLSSFSTMRIERLEKNPMMRAENSEMNLWTGKMYARAQKLKTDDSSFEIRTPTAIAGVRGTKLSVEVGADEASSIMCFDGLVAVRGAAGGEVLLQRKQKTTVTKDQPPRKPQNLDGEEQQEVEEINEVIKLTLDISNPAGNIETHKKKIQVRGRTEPGNTVTVAGQPANTDDKGDFKVSVSLSPGDNEIKIEAASPDGRTIEKTRTVKMVEKKKGKDDGDETGDEDDVETGDDEEEEDEPEEICRPATPGLKVTCPRAGYTTRDSSVSISGAVNSGAEVSINGIPVMMSPGSTAFNEDAGLVEGENDLEITAYACDVYETQVCSQVIKDTTPPMLIVTQPSATFGLDSGACALAGGIIECLVIGQTEENADVSVNNTRVKVESDGSFTHTVSSTYDETTIEIAATDGAGNRTSQILTRDIDRQGVGYIEINASPSSIAGNGRATSIITVRTLNLLREPVSATVTLTATSGGSLADSSLSTSAGAAQTTFTAGISASVKSVTITAAHGAIASSVSLTITPDSPPVPDDR